MLPTIQQRVEQISDNTNLALTTPITMAKIELTGCCSLNCWFCNHKNMQQHNVRQCFISDADFNLILNFLSTMPTIKEVGLFYMGESGLHPKLADYYRMLKEKKYFTFLTTNATQISYIMQAIPYIDSLKVSWNYKNKQDFITHFLQTQNLAMGEYIYNNIIHNIKVLYDTCHKINKELTISTVLDTTPNDYKAALSQLSYDEHYWIPLQNQGGTNKIGADGVIGESEHKRNALPCWSLFKGLYIDCNLNIRTCCYGHNREHIIGSLYADNGNKIRQQLKQEQLDHKIPNICVECLRQLVKNEPQA